MSTAVLIAIATLLQTSEPGTPIVRIQPDPLTAQSLAVRVERSPLIHTGQILPLGPSFAPTSPTEQVLQTFSQLRDVLQAGGAVLSDVVKLNVYVSHPSVTSIVEQELKSRFSGGQGPAVSFVQTTLPEPSTMVAVDAVAVSQRADIVRTVLLPAAAKDQPATAAILPAGGAAYISGQAERGDGSLANATALTMASLLKTLAFLKTTPARVVQVKSFLNPMGDVEVARREIQQAFGDLPCPPLSFVEWRSSLPIEIEMVVATDLPPESEQPPRVEYLTPPGMTTPTVYCRVAKVNTAARIYIGGLFGTQEDPNGPAEAKEMFEQLQAAVEAAGSDLDHLVKGTYYVADSDADRQFNQVRPSYYNPARPPAASKAMVAGTGRPPRTLTLDMIAVPR